MKPLHIYSLGIAVVALLTSHQLSAWTAPSNDPPNPGGVDAPLHTGDAYQYKSGGLGVEGLAIDSTSPTIFFNDTDQRNWWIHANSERLYFLHDRNDNGSWSGESPWPLVLEGGTTAADDIARFNGTVIVSKNGGSQPTALMRHDNAHANLSLGDQSNGMRLEYNRDEDELRIQNATADGSYDGRTVATFRRDGRVGVGTDDPSDRLHVDGGGLWIENPTGNATHFNYVNSGSNYIRGTTRLDGNTTINGNTTMNGTTLVNGRMRASGYCNNDGTQCIQGSAIDKILDFVPFPSCNLQYRTRNGSSWSTWTGISMNVDAPNGDRTGSAKDCDANCAIQIRLNCP